MISSTHRISLTAHKEPIRCVNLWKNQQITIVDCIPEYAHLVKTLFLNLFIWSLELATYVDKISTPIDDNSNASLRLLHTLQVCGIHKYSTQHWQYVVCNSIVDLSLDHKSNTRTKRQIQFIAYSAMREYFVFQNALETDFKIKRRRHLLKSIDWFCVVKRWSTVVDILRLNKIHNWNDMIDILIDSCVVRWWRHVCARRLA